MSTDHFSVDGTLIEAWASMKSFKPKASSGDDAPPPPASGGRNAIEEGFGWIKTVAGQRKTRFRGRDRVGWAFTFAATACNLVRLPKLLEAPA